MPRVLTVSIITPTLNAERFIAGCLASVRAQEFPAAEHLVVDGGSTDATEAVVRDYGATWICCPGLRQAAAINEGIRRSSGEVVAWLNADDLYMTGTLRVVADQFAADNALDVLVGDCEVIGESGAVLWYERPGAYNFERLLRRGNALAQPAVFLRRSVFDRVGLLDESLEYGMDYELWLRLRDLRVTYVPQVLAAFRWHRTSKTARNTRANWRELLLIVRRHGGGWTPQLRWSYARALATLARQHALRRLVQARLAALSTTGKSV